MKAEGPKLGELITEQVFRDCVHVAVFPAVAAEQLQPGQHISLTQDRYQFATSSLNPNLRVGVVDPFLKAPVEKGQKFWIFVYPGTIQSLRHAWTSDKFKVPTFVQEEASE